MSKRKSPAPAALPAPQASEAVTAPVAVPDTSPTTTAIDADNDGHNDLNGQFVEGNTEATDAPEVSEVEANLTAAVEALLAAATAYAEVQSTPQFLLVSGYRLQFAGHDLMTLTVN